MRFGKLLNSLSLNQLAFLRKLVPQKYAQVVEGVLLRKYADTTNFFSVSTDGREICVIEQGEFDFPLFQIFFAESMIRNCIHCLAHGYRPIINFRNSDGINLWEQFLEQPFGSSDDVDLSTSRRCDVVAANYHFPHFPTEDDIKRISEIYARFWRYNRETAIYLEQEYQTILQSKKVLGVLCRGTDYTANRPKGHPVQPQIEDLICKVRDMLPSLGCDYIYLATEEARIYKIFEQAFPGKILTNKRNYYDAFYTLKEQGGDATRISWVHHNRENDNYYKSLEYLSSINLLSKCDSLIAGNCGGSRAALYLNGGKYHYWYLFNLGMY